jgi:hypothetical protein
MGRPHSNQKVFFACIAGAVSAVSWIVASLVGAARSIAPIMAYQDYLMIYILLIAIALTIAIFVMYPFIAKKASYQQQAFTNI